MKLLVIVAHGSRLESSNEEVISLVNNIKKQANESLIVESAFLELCSPSITTCINKNVELNNINEIDIFPYFLAAGKHVKFDIPNEVELLREEHSDIKINLLPHLGKNEALINLILDTQSK